MGYTQSAYDLLPKSMFKALELMIKSLDPDKIVLFGSRARGDHRENSDFDIVIKGTKAQAHEWAKLRLALEEDPITLHKIDLLNWSELESNYIKNINSEGIILYERKT